MANEFKIRLNVPARSQLALLLLSLKITGVIAPARLLPPNYFISLNNERVNVNIIGLFLHTLLFYRNMVLL